MECKKLFLTITFHSVYYFIILYILETVFSFYNNII